jgi:hypothetical protein
VLISSNGSIGRLGSFDKDLRLSGSPQGFPSRVLSFVLATKCVPSAPHMVVTSATTRSAI